MDDWGWEHLGAWASKRLELPVGPLFCIIDGTTRGRPWPQTGGARSCAGSPPRRGCDVGSRHTSCATPTPSRWPARAFR